ncbi:PREDICTED: zinc finger CCCH domain-containing protein 4-like [Branchiostoma belcheri]|uniref:Zinc finger CCCH domain-containing protein 4-like n=1 Tax=Branchiostoma belcheri TaxID=7741 RepID=A0A6P4ZSC0_BRABE|nr:PREDICTED: zinc finger CCCH domain-containing protein 4-like [Branchiostoma belcheri]
MSSAPNEDYVEINENEVSWAKASSQRHVSATKNAGHISSPAKDRNAKEEHTSEVYRRDSWGAESDYLPPISDTNVPDPNMGRLKSNAEDTDEEYEDVGGEEYLDLNPRPSAHHPSLRPGHHPSLRPDHHPSLRPDHHPSLRPGHHPSLRPDHHPSLQPDTYQSLKPDHDQYQRLKPDHDQYQRLHSDQRQSLPPDDHRRLRQSQKQNPDIPEHVDSPDGYQSLRHSQYQKLNIPPGTKDAFRP